MLEFEEDIVCWECGIVETSGEDIVVAEEDIVFAMVPKEDIVLVCGMGAELGDIVLELAEENAGL
jgi:hypothetical protein